MPYTLHNAGLEDVPDIARIFQAAFKDDDIMGYFYPNTPSNIRWDHDIKLYTDLMNEGDIYGGRFTKVVDDDSGKTVAFSKWDFPYTLTAEQKEAKAQKEKKYRSPPVLDGSNGNLLEDFRKQLADGRKKWVTPENMFFLHILAVDPAYQRRGIGSMLIRPGLEAADKAGGKTYIEASPAGLGLYMKYGWEPVDELVIDMIPYGGEGIKCHKMLIREPDAPSKLGKQVD